LDLYEIDERGLDRLDRALLRTLIERFNGGPVGLTTMAMSVGEEAETIESVCEPYLLRSGFLARTPRGRMATSSAWQHLGLTPPPSDRASNHGEIPLQFGD
jgi:Holliday junction DNA helicase RuvB